MRTYQIGDKEFDLESKFFTGKATIGLADIRQNWPNWSQEERLDFLCAYSAKLLFTDEDHRILEFLLESMMDSEDHDVCSSLAILLTKLDNKKKVAEFLLRKIGESTRILDGCFPRANYYQALGFLGDISVCQFIEKRLSEILSDKRLYDVKQPPHWIAFECVACLASLCRLEETEGYYEMLKKLGKEHPSSLVQQSVKAILSELPKK